MYRLHRASALLGAATLGFVSASAVVLWIGYDQPFGMIRHWSTQWPIYPVRLWPLIAILLLSIAFAAVVRRTLPAVQAPHGAFPALVVFATVVSVLTVWALRAYPNSGDEYAFLFQARTFLAGRLWNTPPLHAELFTPSHVFARSGEWVSEYPPGWPGLLAVGQFVGLPFWLIGPLLAGALLIVLFRFCQERGGRDVAVLALVLIVPTAFYLFNAASYFSQMAAALFGLLFCWQGERWLQRPLVGTAIAAGSSLGMLGLIRPFDVVFFALPFAFALPWRGGQRRWLLAPVIAAAGLPFLALYLWHNAAVTGDPFLPIVKWGAPELQLGLAPVDNYGVAKGMGDTARIAMVHWLELAEWTSPLLVLAWPAALIWLGVRRRLWISDWVFPASVLAYLFYPGTGGNEYGPRYDFDAFPLFVASSAVAIGEVLQATRWRGWVQGLVGSHVLTSLVGFAVCAIQFHRVVDERMDLQDLVSASRLSNAVVVVGTGTGVIRHMAPPDLLRNLIDLTGDVVFALDRPDGVARLHEMFPERQIFLYRRDTRATHGTIVSPTSPGSPGR